MLVGTTEDASLFRSDASRRAWRVDGPRFKERSVYSLAADALVPAGRTITILPAVSGG